jgi:hypothetical protein
MALSDHAIEEVGWHGGHRIPKLPGVILGIDAVRVGP